MCVMNTSEKVHKTDWNNYAQRTAGFTKGTDVTDGKTVRNNFEIAPKTLMVVELKQ